MQECSNAIYSALVQPRDKISDCIIQLIESFKIDLKKNKNALLNSFFKFFTFTIIFDETLDLIFLGIF